VLVRDPVDAGPVSTRRRRVVAVAAVVLGAAALGTSTTLHDEVLIEAGADAPVNSSARDPGDIRANNSPSLARNPRRAAELAVTNRVDSPDYSCALQTSRDGGRRWRDVPVRIPRGEGRKCYAPDVAFGADGTLYMSFVTLQGNGNTPAAAWVASSPDGGRTLSAPRRVVGPLAFQVRLTADPRRPKRLFLTFLQADSVGLVRFSGGDQRIQLRRSDDGGRTWSRPSRVSDPRRERILAPSAAVGPGGELYVLYLDVGDDRLDYEGAHEGNGGPPYGGRFSLVLGRSDDAGATWQESVVDDRIVPARRFIAFLPPTPSLAVDPSSGKIYAAFEDGARRPADVHVWSLARGAGRWRGPTRVNDTPAGDRTSQYLPRIAVAPGGRLDVAYYDRRRDVDDKFSDVSLQSSSDGGRTFSPHATLTNRRFDSRIGAGSEVGLPDLGNRLGLVSERSAALAVWADTRAGSVGSSKQDIAFARAAVSRPWQRSSAMQALLRYGGIVVLLGGLALLMAASRPRPRPRAA